MGASRIYRVFCGSKNETFPSSLSGPVLFLVLVLVWGSGCGLIDAMQGGDSGAGEPPQVEIVSAPSSPTNETSAEFEFECLEARDCQFECRLDDREFEECASPLEYDGLGDGFHVFEVIAVSGGVESEPAQWQWNIDTQIPLIEDLTGPPEITDQDDAEISFSCSKDDCSFECRLDEEEFDMCQSPQEYEDLEDGTYRFSVRATDEAGNQGPEETHEWTVDTTSPLVTSLEGPADPTNSTSATFEFECSKNDCSFECELSGTEFSTCESGIEYTELDEGNHNFVVVATDEFDNIGPAATWAWEVDTSPPEIVIGDKPPSQIRENEATFEFECADEEVCTFECALDYDDGSGSEQIGEFEDCSSPHAVDGLKSGTHTLHIRATDEAGNEADESVDWLVLGWTAISAGSNHSCGVQNDGSLWCWGQGEYGRLGLGDDDNRLEPAQVGDESNWRSISGGAWHSCGIKDDGTLWCWGHNGSGRLGHGNGQGTESPKQVGDGDDWTNVSAGNEHTCGVREDGRLWCWGFGSDGRLGLGDTGTMNTPQQVGEGQWSNVSAGTRHTCGVQSDARLWCWGYGLDGRLGLGEIESEDMPQEVGADEDWQWQSVSAGNSHSCGVQSDGSLWCWGLGTEGRLGLGGQEDQTTPQRVGEDDDWQSVAAGNRHTCGVRNDGSLWCWGDSSDDQLGLENPLQTDTPQQVGGDEDWRRVSTGRFHTCATRSDGSLWCWGRGAEGRLGLGDESNQSTPQQVTMP